MSSFKSNNYIWSILILCMIMLFACKKNVNLLLPTDADELVINSLYNDQEPIGVFMTKTISPRDTNYSATDPSLIISLDENGKFKELVNFDSNRGIYMSTTIPKTGNTYKISVKRVLNGNEEVYAENTLPQAVTITNISFKDSTIQNGVNYYGELRFTINDAPGFDYYRLIINAYNSNIQRFIPIGDFNSNDPVLDDDSTIIINGYRYFSDKQFRNGSHEFKILVLAGNFYTNGRNILEIETSSLSIAYFEYLKSLKAYNAAYNPRNPLNNPVQLYSNTSNNLGIFAGYSIRRDTIQ